MKARTSLRDVAKAAGVSVATASQALRNDRNSSRATCERVQRIASEIGYRANPMLAQLASRRFRGSKALANTPLVFATDAKGQAPSYWRYLDELRECGERRGYVIVHEPIESAEYLRQAARRWYHKGVRGVIFGTFERDDWIEGIDWAPFSVVLLGGRCPRTLFNTVKADVVDAVRRSLDALASRVPGRIGAVLHHHEHELRDDVLREGTVRMWMERLSPERRVPIHFERFEVPYDEQRTNLDAWLRRYRPDGIAGFTLAFFQALNLRYLPGEGRLFMAINQDELGVSPTIPGAIEPIMLQARRAIDLLDGMIRHGEVGMPEQPVEILVPPEWMAPESSVGAISGMR